MGPQILVTRSSRGPYVRCSGRARIVGDQPYECLLFDLVFSNYFYAS